MSSIIEGYNYDIFISYRQKDNKGDRWVSEFVEALKTELESTFKEEISVYFDINPHDGLLETHDVDASLKDKLKCLVLIPIISRTYCDPKSFAWEHEFKAFVEQASKDQFGLKVKLSNGNVASRVLPLRIHDLDTEDVKLCESVLGGVLRGIEFNYKETGFNRPLKPDDNDNNNLNKTKYRNQITKVTLAIKEIVSGLKKEPIESLSERKEVLSIEDKPLIKDKSIIVLPFENMSSDPEQEYFSDGLTEEIITDLSHINDLLVISRNSAMTFKRTKNNTKEIAKEVNVRYVLEGSVRKSGNNLRIIAQLIDAITDTHLWAEKYSGTLDDVFDIQEKVALAISDTLRLKLTEPEERQIAKRPIPNVQAHDFYLRACDVMYRAFTSEGIDEAIGFLESGLRIMGNNALLLATLANAYMHGVRVWVKEEDDLVKAEVYARKALNLDPDMAQANIVLGWIRWLQGKPREYYHLLKKALLLDPNDVETITWAYWLFISTGKTSKALNMAKHMIELDPIHPYRFFYSAVVHAYEGRFEQAIEELRSQTPASILEQPAWLAWLGPWLVYAGRIDEAIDALEPIEKETAWNIYVQWSRLLRFALKGEMDHVDEVASNRFRERVKRDCYVSCFLSGIYAMLGDRKEAFYWLEIAVDHGFINYPYLSEYDPLITKLKDEPQFQKLMERVKHEWGNFEE